MRTETKSPFITFCGILGAIALGAIVVKSVNPTCSLPPLDAERGAERKAARTGLQDDSVETLAGYALINEVKETYRVPVDQAIDIVSEEWKSPSEGRTELMKRADKAFDAPALSEFE